MSWIVVELLQNHHLIHCKLRKKDLCQQMSPSLFLCRFLCSFWLLWDQLQSVSDV